ncbi:MAG: sel1 repeat family protein [Bacteroidaceae bacterium]|nr:sel1 repeat family protein [Bacteroidaceae bacterium]
MKKLFGFLLAILTWMPAIAQSSAEIDSWFSEAEIDSWFKKGSEGYTQGNYTEAIKWWRKAAEQGHAGSYFYMGICYYFGHGVEQSYAEAAKCWEKIAVQGYADAQYNIGLCYLNGRGVEQSNTEAVKWLRKAAEQGRAEAQNELGWYYLGEGATQNLAEAKNGLKKLRSKTILMPSMGWASTITPTTRTVYPRLLNGGDRRRCWDMKMLNNFSKCLLRRRLC